MDKIKILLVENVHPVAEEKLLSDGFSVKRITHAPDEKELIELVKDYDVLGIRSKTEVTAKVLDANPKLLAIGAFCIGTNQINLEKANQMGVPAFNAPYSNTRSVAEMVIAEMIMLARQLGDRNTAAHKGEWVKSASGAYEIRGKKLGIVGYGHIGSQVSILAEALGMKVHFYDIVKKLPLGNAMSCSTLDELLKISDFVTLHVPETPLTREMIADSEFKKMKKGAFLINASRGTVVNISDLEKALKSGQVGECAIDVFPEEPSSNKEKFISPLQNLSNVVLTPHIGGSTEEAQYAIGVEVAESFTRFLKIGSTLGAVNFPKVDIPLTAGAKRLVNVHRNEPGILSEINGIVSKFGANILAQALSTDSHIGYLVMDVEHADAENLNREIGKLTRSIRTRVL